MPHKGKGSCGGKKGGKGGGYKKQYTLCQPEDRRT